jgi:hypothetical protein
MGAAHDTIWSIFELILSEKLPLRASWNRLLDNLTTMIPAEYWQDLKALEIEQEQKELRHWIENLLSDNPLPGNVKAIWIGIPRLWDESVEDEYYGLYLWGADEYEPNDVEWACSPVYEPDGYIKLNVLKSAENLIKTDEENYAYSAFSLSEIFRTKLKGFSNLESEDLIYCAVGYDNGDFINLNPIAK